MEKTVPGSAIIWSGDNTYLIDVPRSVQEACRLPHALVSEPAPELPFELPEPRNGKLLPQSAYLFYLQQNNNEDLKRALETISESKPPFWCYPRNIQHNDRHNLWEVLRSYNDTLNAITAFRNLGPYESILIDSGGEYQCDLAELWGQVFRISDYPVIFRVSFKTGVAPKELCQDHCVAADSQFLLGDVTLTRHLIVSLANEIGLYDVVVLDPPWLNASNTRKGQYKSMENVELSKVPIPKLLRMDGLVAIWVTNAKGISKFVTETLFKRWRMQYLTTWLWLKVTSNGRPIFDMNSENRVPFEQLVIACRQDFPTKPSIPRKIFLGVPDLHSRKPALHGVFDELLGKRVQGLEIFARSVPDGWTAWGDQVLSGNQAL